MTENAIKEELSRSYLETIANRTGYFNANSKDYGTDMNIRQALLDPASNRYMTTGKAIDIQIKATTEKYFWDIDNNNTDTVRYNLEMKTYLDLIRRSNTVGSIIPLYLAVFVMPEGNMEWLKYSTDGIELKRRAYWFQIPPGTPPPANRSKCVIKIPKSNIITMMFFHDAFSRLT